MRIASGIQGLDELLDGGIPENFVVLLTGAIGTGKTIFGMQFLCSSKDHGIYLSFEEDLDQLRETARMFNWDVASREREKSLKMIKFDPFRLEDVVDIVENSIREINARRIVIDSISALGIYMRETSDIRRIIIQLGDVMKKSKCTALLISEMPHNGAMSRFGVEEFVADGVILLDKAIVNNEYKRLISIAKMRYTNHSEKIHAYSITKNGLSIK